MDVFQAIQTRRSIRSFKSAEIEYEKLQQVLEAARLAPSAANRQDWKFIVVTDKATREKLVAAANGQKYVAEAPVVLVGIATDPGIVMPCGQPTGVVDVSIAFSFMLLEATELGLGTVWLGAFNEGTVKQILGIPEQMRVIAMTPLGYPDQSPASRPRKDSGEIICNERFS